jgi:hypothetical protein
VPLSVQSIGIAFLKLWQDSKEVRLQGLQWLTPVILATQEAEIRKIMVG